MAKPALISLLVLAVIHCSVSIPTRKTGVINTDNPTAIPGEYNVMLKRGHHSTNIQSLFPDVQLEFEHKLGQRRFALVKTSRREIVDRMAQHPLVDYIEANLAAKLISPTEEGPSIHAINMKKSKVPQGRNLVEPPCKEEPPNGDEKWGITRTSYHDRPVNYNTTSYRYAFDGEGVDIYVMDTGIDISHYLFNQTGQTRAQYGMVASGVTGGELDKNGHGSHVSGTAAGDQYGIAPMANLISCKVLGTLGAGSSTGSTQAFAWMIERVQNQTNAGKKPKAVVNMSLGGSGYSQTLYDAVDEAAAENVVTVVAAGNSGEDASGSWPAGFDNTITVGATNSTDHLAEFSNYGTIVDIGAPGVWIWSAESADQNNVDPGQISRKSGTSMACPHVTGVVAAYLSQLDDTDLPYVNPHSIKNMLQETASVGYIQYPINEKTIVNYLLYDNCGTTPYDIKLFTSTTTPATTTTTTAPSTTTILQSGSATSISAGLLQVIVGLLASSFVLLKAL